MMSAGKKLNSLVPIDMNLTFIQSHWGTRKQKTKQQTNNETKQQQQKFYNSLFEKFSIDPSETSET